MTRTTFGKIQTSYGNFHKTKQAKREPEQYLPEKFVNELTVVYVLIYLHVCQVNHSIETSFLAT